jgi:thiamine pyrophosphate-dependent acetolactate synthase large subunit-like protein
MVDTAVDLLREARELLSQDQRPLGGVGAGVREYYDELEALLKRIDAFLGEADQ